MPWASVAFTKFLMWMAGATTSHYSDGGGTIRPGPSRGRFFDLSMKRHISISQIQNSHLDTRMAPRFTFSGSRRVHIERSGHLLWCKAPRGNPKVDSWWPNINKFLTLGQVTNPKDLPKDDKYGVEYQAKPTVLPLICVMPYIDRQSKAIYSTQDALANENLRLSVTETSIWLWL